MGRIHFLFSGSSFWSANERAHYSFCSPFFTKWKLCIFRDLASIVGKNSRFYFPVTITQLFALFVQLILFVQPARDSRRDFVQAQHQIFTFNSHFFQMHYSFLCVFISLFRNLINGFYLHYSGSSDIFIKRFKAILHLFCRFFSTLEMFTSFSEIKRVFALFDKNHRFNVRTIAYCVAQWENV